MGYFTTKTGQKKVLTKVDKKDKLDVVVKYKLYLSEMLEQNKEIFDKFRPLHDKYAQDPETHQNQYNQEGQKVLDTVRKYENKLCGRSERSVYSKFSSQLADKFHDELRKIFPKIDFIGVKITSNEIPFQVKRIKL